MNFEKITNGLDSISRKIELKSSGSNSIFYELALLSLIILEVAFYVSTVRFWKKRRCDILENDGKKYCVDCLTNKECNEFSSFMRKNFPELKDGTYISLLDEKEKS
jgi:hypothetical protein